MHLEADPTYVLKLTRKEIRVVGLALAGKLKAQEDIKLAAELNVRILEARKRVAQEELTYLEGTTDLVEGT